MKNHVIKAIRERRSIRKFIDRKIPLSVIRKIIEAGTWAPSGMNNQPWRFVIVAEKQVQAEIGALTHSGKIVNGATSLIIVFLDKRAAYDLQKDTQSIGACIQNLLLAAHSLGLGACWVGEILRNEHKVHSLLAVPSGLELQAVIALGHPAEKPRSSRKSLDKVILKTIM